MKVLFIGNSHTFFNDMPQLFARMVEEGTGEQVEAVMLAYSGRSLEWHEKEYFSLRFNLLYGGYDYCVIQQAAHPFPPEEETLQNGTRIIELCKSVDTKPVLFMTWAEEKKPENQQQMIDVYSRLAQSTGALLAPVGAIWQQVQKRYPDISLYWKRDGAHASPYGDYLIAATLYQTITGGDLEILSDTGLDFGAAMDIDFQSPTVCEQPKEILISLESDKVQKIKEIIKNFIV
ncbi:MAG: hypothetical protein PHE02_13405 [Lachnospiraceae bacterium]|nr:hypothetical protein [Lachnospiraceae bacterium]